MLLPTSDGFSLKIHVKEGAYQPPLPKLHVMVSVMTIGYFRYVQNDKIRQLDTFIDRH